MKRKTYFKTALTGMWLILLVLPAVQGQDPLHSIRQEYLKWYTGDYYETVSAIFDAKRVKQQKQTYSSAVSTYVRQKQTCPPRANTGTPYELKYNFDFISYVNPYQYYLNSDSWWLIAEEYVFYQDLIFKRTPDVLNFPLYDRTTKIYYLQRTKN